MVTVQEKMDTIEAGPNYVSGSLIIKSSDDRGVVLKWLEQSNGVAERKEHFIQLDEDESNLPLEERTAINDIEIEPPSG